jgi:hypothetical protein
MKDYVDLYFLINEKKYKILQLLQKATKKDSGMDPFVWSQIIGDVSSLETLPKMIRSLKQDEIYAFYKIFQVKILKSLNPT